MNSETVDLIATDPPFNTKRNRSGSAGFYVDNWKWGDSGKLPDQWAWNEVHPVWLEQIKDDNPALYEVIDAARVSHDDDIAAFLCFLSVRLLEMHRVLKPTGSIYLHCDHTANGYIRMAMDAIFGHRNFQNEIVWYYGGGGASSSRFARKHDTLMFYTKSSEWTFNVDAVRMPHKWTAGQLRADGSARDYRKGKLPDDVMVIPNEMDIEYGDDLIQMHKIMPWSSENTGSPDQKPLALYERIVLASSDKGDIVLDPFAGCATTIMAARKHGRKWVGIDRRVDARYHVACRMAGIKPKDAEAIRKRPDLVEWLDSQLAKYDAHYSTDAPVRTDAGETAAPFLGPVFSSANQRSILNHAEMRAILVEHFGLQCWCCDFTPPIAGYLHLDHINPRNGGGGDHLFNRALLCQVCNQEKSDSKTLVQMRRDKQREGLLTGGHPIDLAKAYEWTFQYLMNEMQKRPQQMPLGD